MSHIALHINHHSYLLHLTSITSHKKQSKDFFCLELCPVSESMPHVPSKKLPRWWRDDDHLSQSWLWWWQFKVSLKTSKNLNFRTIWYRFQVNSDPIPMKTQAIIIAIYFEKERGTDQCRPCNFILLAKSILSKERQTKRDRAEAE